MSIKLDRIRKTSGGLKVAKKMTPILLCSLSLTFLMIALACVGKVTNNSTTYPPLPASSLSSVTSFPIQLITREANPAGILEGRLILKEGYLRLKPDNDAENSYLLIWPTGSLLRLDNNIIQVLNTIGKFTTGVGDYLIVGGGGVSAPVVEKEIGYTLPQGCEAPYWLVSGKVKSWLPFTSTSGISPDNVNPTTSGFSEGISSTVTVTTKEPAETISVSLNQTKPYLVVGQGNLAIDSKTRTAGMWFIIAPEADSLEEYAQTAILAVLDLYVLYNNTSTNVTLIPDRDIKVNYAEAHFAVDGKGAEGMTGSAPAVPKYWHVRVMDDLPYNEQELAILALWQEKQVDFPSRNLLSSLSYDEKALRQYIADTLNITYSETQVRQLKTVEYKVNEDLGLNQK